MEISNLPIHNPEKQEKAMQRIMKIATTNLVKKKMIKNKEILKDYFRIPKVNILTHKENQHEIT